MNRQKVIIITGPTASGKSALAVDVARRLGTEVISADSRQIYRDIPVATAAPTREEMQGVRHHLIGTHSLDETYSASKFEADALAIIRRLHHEGKPAVVCGGSMLYVDALRFGIDEMPEADPGIRASLMEEWKRYGDARLRLRLLGADPEYYARVDLDNMKRVFHALEVSLTAGRPYSSLLTGRHTDREFDCVTLCIDRPREELFDRINRRTLLMMEQGLLDEAKATFHLRHLNSLNTVGLKEMYAHLEGKFTLDEAIARIQKNTRVYAKKQLTWYRKDPGIIWVKDGETELPLS